MTKDIGVDGVLTAIRLAKLAIESKGGRVYDQSFRSEPNYDDPLGQLVEAKYSYTMPYECKGGHFELNVRKVKHRMVVLIEFKPNFEDD